MNGGDGSVNVSGSPGVCFAPHWRSWVRKYGERETRINRCEEKTAIAFSWFEDEKLPVRAIRTSE